MVTFVILKGSKNIPLCKDESKYIPQNITQLSKTIFDLQREENVFQLAYCKILVRQNSAGFFENHSKGLLGRGILLARYGLISIKDSLNSFMTEDTVI